MWSSSQDQVITPQRVLFRATFLLAPSLLTASARHNIDSGFASCRVYTCQGESESKLV